MREFKICSQCHEAKDLKNSFYTSSGTWRSECKACTIKRNVCYQRKTKAWKYRFVDEDTRRQYMRDYYSKNKERFAKYRSKFRLKNPEYYKDYFRKKKER